MRTRSVKRLATAAVFAGVVAYSGSPALAQGLPPWESGGVGIFEIGDQTTLFGTGILAANSLRRFCLRT